MDPPRITSAGPAVVGVLLPSPVPHLDRVFDYSVPADMRETARFGTRVRVRFHGRLRTGFVVAEKDQGDVAELRDIVEVKGPPVLTPALASLTRGVAARTAGLWGDVLTAAVPARHVRAERAVLGGDGQLPPPLSVDPAAGELAPDGAAGWEAFTAICGDIAAGGVVRAAAAVPPATDWQDLAIAAVRAALAARRRALVVVPDDQDADVVLAALVALLGAARVQRLTADLGPQARYRGYLRALSGQVDVVVGTRSAVFTPLPDLGLIWLWRDDDSALADPQAPYWHAFDVAGLRSAHEDVSLVVAGRVRSPQAQRLVRLGWAREASPDRSVWRGEGPVVRTPSEYDLGRDAAAFSARMPASAFEVVKAALPSGPVLVQVPRRGYVPMLACANCRALARCPQCEGPLALVAAGGAPSCRRCGTQVAPWACAGCGGDRLRAVRVGSGRTAEELARAFPNVPVLRSDAASGVLETVPDSPALVVATTGAEPLVAARAEAHADRGREARGAVRGARPRYAAALLLDGHVLLDAPRLTAHEDALAKWSQAVALVRPTGAVLLLADPGVGPVQALVRADPIGWAERELDQREATSLPPVTRVFEVAGPAAAAAEVSAAAAKETGAELIGPLAVEDGPRGRDRQRWLVRCDHARSAAVAASLARIQRHRSAAKRAVVAVRADPADLD